MNRDKRGGKVVPIEREGGKAKRSQAGARVKV